MPGYLLSLNMRNMFSLNTINMTQWILGFIFIPVFGCFSQNSLCFTVAPSSPLNTSLYAQNLLAEDLNNDLIPDLAVSVTGNGNMVVYNGTGNGTFSTSTVYSGMSTPEALVTRDFNNDNFKDIAICSFNSNQVRIYFGTASGTFTTPANIFISGGPIGITSDDFNGDGFFDLATAAANGNSVHILLGNGLGAFTTYTTMYLGGFPVSVVSANLNGDAFKDLVIAKKNANQIAVLLGTGTGSFTAPTNFSCAAGPNNLCVGDFNADGATDVASANYNSSSMSVFIGTGTGSFSPAVTYTTGINAFGVACADFNNDGNQDLATSYGSNIKIFTGNGTGSFSLATSYPVGTGPTEVATADFNGDGRMDIATPHIYTYSVDVHLNTPGPLVSITGAGTLCAGSSLTLSASGAPSYSWNVGSSSPGINITPTLTTVYTVTGSIANGCKHSSSVTVPVTPTALAVSGPSVICYGNSAGISASGASTYSWSNGFSSPSITVSPTVSSVYTVSGTNACGIYSKNFTVSVNPTPTLNIISNPSSICKGQSTTLTVNGANSYTWNQGGNSYSIIVSPTVSSAYSVNGTAANGCIGNTIAGVTVNALPSLTVSGINPVCNGMTATLSVAGANTYSWSNGSTNTLIAISPTATAAYSVTGTDVNNCTGNFVFTETVNPVPQLMLNSTHTLICSGQSPTMTVGGALTYTWNPGGYVGPQIAVTPTATTIYTVTGELNGCYNNDTLSITVDLCTGMVDAESNKKISIYPNPGDGHFNISSGGKEVLFLEIYNSSGEKVHEQFVNDSLESIDIAQESEGLYLIRIMKNQRVIQVVRVLKQ